MFEWTQPARIVSPYGTLLLNQDIGDGRRYLVRKSPSMVQRSLRVTKDEVPQGDGAILHRRFADGTELRFELEYWENAGDFACEATAREMAEDLALHLNAILNGDGRLYWQPSDYNDERLLDNARWLVELTHTWEENGPVAKFGIDGPFPYFIDSTEVSTAISDTGTGSGVTITNDGNADFYPVIIVDGPTTGFTITNETTGLAIVYDSTRPGAIAIGSGDIGEFDTFRQTAYLGIGGEPGDDTNIKPGVDPEMTDYFALVPGGNEVTVVGADITVKHNHAWIPS